MIGTSIVALYMRRYWQSPTFTPDIIYSYQWKGKRERPHPLMIRKRKPKAPVGLTIGIVHHRRKLCVVRLAIAGIEIAHDYQWAIDTCYSCQQPVDLPIWRACIITGDDRQREQPARSV